MMRILALPILSLFLLFSAMNSNAQSVNEKSARTAAFNFLQSKNVQTASTPDGLILIPVSGTTIANPELYVFNNPSGGFVIISGEQSAVPVIGYSYTGSVPTGNWNSNFKYWIDNSIAQMQFYRQNSTKAVGDIETQWNFLLTSQGTSPFTSSKAILPFIRSTWNQDGAYNDMCPEDAQGEALVGCVATAMAQIIYYYRYPTTGTGSHSYYASGYGNQSVNYGATTYNYDEMLGDLTYPAPEVAKLSYHCGVSVNMSYGYDGSGAFTMDVDDALEDYFRYSTDASYKTKFSYTTSTWESLMRTNLDLYHPVFYSGSGSSGGHAFIVDGYEGTNYFHFNWGWGGYADGYFYINSLNPAGSDFNSDNQAVVNIYPIATSYPYGCSGTKTLTGTFGTVEDGSGPMANYAANANCSWLISPVATCDYFKINFEELNIASDDQVTIYEGNSSSGTVVGTYNGATIPSQITVNSSQVFITFTGNATNQDKGFLLNYSGHVPLSCSGITNLTAETDTFDDGSGTNHYGNGSFCRWYIAPPGATSITLHFLSFALADEYDYIKVIDGVGGTTMGEYYNGDNPSSITVNSGKMTVMFQTNSSVTADGFNVFYTITTGIEDQPTGVSMRVYPNPASDFLNIIPGSQVEQSTIVIYDFSGRCVFRAETNGDAFLIPLNNFAGGIYQVGLISDHGNVWQKVVVE
ncbi:MAG: hypothetical protein CVU11_11945 [Bacteroidetes bacterium HGW-Bacteroidetes-6]|nr:MAG: hypothetical protein CVU11_11945 [Bacteroidetes bacterium HGW-Bacteroidetes-6]